jgi:translation elongation factor EF-G
MTKHYKNMMDEIINKMDEDRADYTKIIDDLRQHFDATFVPTFIPMGQEKDFKESDKLRDKIKNG